MVYVLKGKVVANPKRGERRYTMETYKQLSHTTYLCNYHVVFCPKYRFRILQGKLGQKVRDWIRKISEWKGVEILEGHISKDHVHLVLSIPPKYAVSEVIGTIKGRVAIRLFKQVPEVRKKYWGRRFWSRGYFVSTIGVDETIIRRYVQKQEVKERQSEQLGFDW
jgi:putative transposase